MIARSADELRREAQIIGEKAAKGELSDHACIEILAAVVEELADTVDRLQRELQKLK